MAPIISNCHPLQDTQSTYEPYSAIQTGGGGRLTPPKTIILYYSRTIASTIFLLREVSSNLPGNNLVLSGFGS